VTESLDLVFQFTLGAEHDYGRFRDTPEHRQERDAVDFRHHHVEHDDVGRPFAHERERRLSVGCAAHLEAVMT
jgi:hypothetical protein